MATLQCEIVTPERRLYAAEAGFVVLPGAEGEMGVLPQHAPTVTTLKSGCVKVTPDGSNEPVRFVVAGGYAQVDGKQVIVLADRATAVADIDFEAAAEQAEAANARLSALAQDDPNRAFAESEVEWINLLLAQK